MKILKIKSASLLTLLIVIAGILSCNKGETQVTSLTVSPDSMAFPSIGGSAEIQIFSNSQWTITKESDWFNLNAFSAEGNRTIKIDVLVNENTSERSAVLTIKAEELTKKIKIFQKGYVSGNIDSTNTNELDTTIHISYTILPDNSGMRKLTSNELIREMKAGWNLGNSLEAIGGETAWGNPLTTQELIDSVKAAGFNAVRIPVAWSKFSDESNFIIQESFMDRVEEVTNYILNDGMYAIINIHWDSGWMQPTYKQQEYVNNRLEIMWDQIATRFRDYDDHLLFAGTNEVMVTGNYSSPSKEYYTVQNSFNQTFVNTVRKTGGKNVYRYLAVQGFNTNIDYTINFAVMPTDVAKNRLIMEVHYYDPYNFTINEKSTITQWGKNATDPSKTETWANESYADNQFNKMKTNFVDKGIPVIIGEYGAMARTTFPEHAAYREYYMSYITHSIYSHGLTPFYWDSGFTGNNASGLFNRSTGQQAYPNIIKAIIEAVK